jgi:AMP nucleosidase
MTETLEALPDPGNWHGYASRMKAFDDADAAVQRISEIYATGISLMRSEVARLLDGTPPAADATTCRYPYLGMIVGANDIAVDARLSHGAIFDPGIYGTTLTRPDIFAEYYREQIGLLLRNHRVPVYVGVSERRMPLPFVIEDVMGEASEAQLREMTMRLPMPDLAEIDDDIANGTRRGVNGEPKPLSLFTAERVDFALARLTHYTATSPRHFQRFVLLTNYSRYVEEFRDIALAAIADGDEYSAFVEPGDAVTANPRFGGAAPPAPSLGYAPQMPAYHLVRPDGNGITLVNIGVGPSNAKTITDSLAVLRPHAWLMLGHCAGLRRTQALGDYVLAHAYLRADHVLDDDLPPWVPVPPIAEVQIALQSAIEKVTQLSGAELKSRMRVGTVATTDNRNWELRYRELAERLNQARAIGVDMESATLAANGFRFRVPYGTLLCVSDLPAHGVVKAKTVANGLYQRRIGQHLCIGIEAIRLLREQGVVQLHSRKLRSFDEPGFR